MKLKVCVCLFVGGLVIASQAMATPLNTSRLFLSVDINGANTAGGQAIGPTQANFQPWDVTAITDEFDPNFNAVNNWTTQAVPGMVKTFATTEGNITATLYGSGTSYSARNRGANSGGFPDLYRDFVFAQRDNAIGFGRNYLKLKLSGLIPNNQYEFTGFAREPVFTAPNLADPNDPGQSYQSWTDLGKLGGLDGPAAWLDTNVGAGASYQPAVGGVNNPIPKYARSQDAGPDSLSANVGAEYFHSASFYSTADASGTLTLYTWADPNGFGSTVQGASLLNGFQVGLIPEPASVVLFVAGLIGLVGLRRRFR
jgi:PEP-CTERM motif-containing protein